MNDRNVTDRIERVKVALMGMQRYNWEQGVAAQAMLELGEDDHVVSLARASIMRQREGRFAVIGGYSPITDSASVGEAVLYAAKITGDPIFKKGADEMLEVIFKTDHKSANGTIYHTQEPNKTIMSDASTCCPRFWLRRGITVRPSSRSRDSARRCGVQKINSIHIYGMTGRRNSGEGITGDLATAGPPPGWSG